MRAVAGASVWVQGDTVVFKANALEYRCRPEIRTRVFALDDARPIVNVIHQKTKLEPLSYFVRDGHLVVTSGHEASRNINASGDGS